MKWIVAALVFFIASLVQMACAAQAKVAATSQVADTGTVDGNGVISQKSPALTGVRRPLYRLRKSDVVEIRFTFSPEFDQTATVQPDGFVSLKGDVNVLAEGLTLPEFRDVVRDSYSAVLHSPEISVLLEDFEKPFFLAGGQVAKPGKYELRSPTTVTEAIAVAGGFTEQARHSQVVLFRKSLDGMVETHVLNVKSMLASRMLAEDMELKPGDMLYVPQNRISKIKKFLPASSLSTFFTPAQF
jgi:polysaccharide export outer membrane protein